MEKEPPLIFKLIWGTSLPQPFFFRMLYSMVSPFIFPFLLVRCPHSFRTHDVSLWVFLEDLNVEVACRELCKLLDMNTELWRGDAVAAFDFKTADFPWAMASISRYKHMIPVVLHKGGGGSFKNWKPIGEVGCCESRMAERIHWWTERWLRSPLFLSLSLSFSPFLWLSTYLRTYVPTYLPTYLSIYLPVYLSIYLSS